MPTILTAAADAAAACPHCHEVLRVNLKHAGCLARCRCCGQRFKVPTRRELIDFAASFLIEEDVTEELSQRLSLAERRARGERIEPPPVNDPFADER